MCLKKCFVACSLSLLSLASHGQDNRPDSLPPVDDPTLGIDTSLNYDDLLGEFANFLDSLLAPKSYLLINASIANGFFNYKNNAGTVIDTKKKSVFSPIIGYYHKSGPGITWAGNIANTAKGQELYQHWITPSFDFIQNRKWLAGIAYTHYFTKDSLRFYTTPLQNDINAYFLWRKSWLQPGLAASYGWGSRSDVKKRERYLQLLRLRSAGIVTTTSTEESISDFSICASIRHSFYWVNLSKNNDYIKFTPVLSFTSGTQQYGFNQTTGSYAVVARNTGKVEYYTGSVNLDNTLKFQPLALTLYLRPEYAIGKFFIQPQLIFDYYFPADEKQFNTFFAVNGGFMF